MSVLLSDVPAIPLAAGDEDYVLRLTDGIAFHLLAAESMEEALFSWSVRQVRALHPSAPLPALYIADALLADADRMRARVGDDRFFAGLNGGAQKKADQWSRLLGDDTTWTLDSYAAKAAAPCSQLQQNLVTALTREYFASYTRQAEFVDLDTGLTVIAEHAKSLRHIAAHASVPAAKGER